MLNLALFHLLLAPVAIVLDIGALGFMIPLIASLSVIAFTFVRSHQTEQGAPWFIAAHWKLAMRRYRILLTVYLISSAIVGVGLLVGMRAEDSNMAGIMLTVFSRIAAAPLLIGVILCFVLESGSIYQAGRGEVPDAMANRFPPPADVDVKD